MNISKPLNNSSRKANNALLFLYLILLVITIAGCNGHRVNISKDTLHRVQSIDNATKVLDERLINLLNKDSSEKATQIIDSLIIKNKANGSLFYEKGFIYEYNERFEDAILCFQKAESLGFDKRLCTRAISFCKTILGDISHLKKRVNPTSL